MPAVAQRASREAVAAVYEDLRELIARESARIARRHPRLDVEEAEAEANLIFLETYHTHVPGRSRLAQRVTHLLRVRLLDRARTEHTWDERGAGAGLDPDRYPAPPTGAGVLAGLGDDARTVAALLTDTPPEVQDAVRAAPPRAAAVRAVLRAHLTGLGWAGARVTEAFTEITEALA